MLGADVSEAQEFSSSLVVASDARLDDVPGFASVSLRAEIPSARADDTAGIFYRVAHWTGLRARDGAAVEAEFLSATDSQPRFGVADESRAGRAGVVCVRGDSVAPYLFGVEWLADGGAAADGGGATIRFAFGADDETHSLSGRRFRIGGDGSRVYDSGLGSVSLSVVSGEARLVDGVVSLTAPREGEVATVLIDYHPEGIGATVRVAAESRRVDSPSARLGPLLLLFNAESGDGVVSLPDGRLATMVYGRMNGLGLAYSSGAVSGSGSFDVADVVCGLGAEQGWRAASLPEAAALLGAGRVATLASGASAPDLKGGDVFALPDNFAGRGDVRVAADSDYYDYLAWLALRGETVFADFDAGVWRDGSGLVNVSGSSSSAVGRALCVRGGGGYPSPSVLSDSSSALGKVALFASAGAFATVTLAYVRRSFGGSVYAVDAEVSATVVLSDDDSHGLSWREVAVPDGRSGAEIRLEFSEGRETREATAATVIVSRALYAGATIAVSVRPAPASVMVVSVDGSAATLSAAGTRRGLLIAAGDVSYLRGEDAAAVCDAAGWRLPNVAEAAGILSGESARLSGEAGPLGWADGLVVPLSPSSLGAAVSGFGVWTSARGLDGSRFAMALGADGLESADAGRAVCVLESALVSSPDLLGAYAGAGVGRMAWNLAAQTISITPAADADPTAFLTVNARAWRTDASGNLALAEEGLTATLAGPAGWFLREVGFGRWVAGGSQGALSSGGMATLSVSFAPEFGGAAVGLLHVDLSSVTAEAPLLVGEATALDGLTMTLLGERRGLTVLMGIAEADVSDVGSSCSLAGAGWRAPGAAEAAGLYASGGAVGFARSTVPGYGAGRNVLLAAERAGDFSPLLLRRDLRGLGMETSVRDADGFATRVAPGVAGYAFATGAAGRRLAACVLETDGYVAPEDGFGLRYVVPSSAATIYAGDGAAASLALTLAGVGGAAEFYAEFWRRDEKGEAKFYRRATLINVAAIQREVVGVDSLANGGVRVSLAAAPGSGSALGWDVLLGDGLSAEGFARMVIDTGGVRFGGADLRLGGEALGAVYHGRRRGLDFMIGRAVASAGEAEVLCAAGSSAGWEWRGAGIAESVGVLTESDSMTLAGAGSVLGWESGVSATLAGLSGEEGEAGVSDVGSVWTSALEVDGSRVAVSVSDSGGAVSYASGDSHYAVCVREADSASYEGPLRLTYPFAGSSLTIVHLAEGAGAATLGAAVLELRLPLVERVVAEGALSISIAALPSLLSATVVANGNGRATVLFGTSDVTAFASLGVEGAGATVYASGMFGGSRSFVYRVRAGLSPSAFPEFAVFAGAVVSEGSEVAAALADGTTIMLRHAGQVRGLHVLTQSDSNSDSLADGLRAEAACASGGWRLPSAAEAAGLLSEEDSFAWSEAAGIAPVARGDDDAGALTSDWLWSGERFETGGGGLFLNGRSRPLSSASLSLAAFSVDETKSPVAVSSSFGPANFVCVFPAGGSYDGPPALAEAWARVEGETEFSFAPTTSGGALATVVFESAATDASRGRLPSARVSARLVSLTGYALELRGDYRTPGVLTAMISAPSFAVALASIGVSPTLTLIAGSEFGPETTVVFRPTLILSPRLAGDSGWTYFGDVLLTGRARRVYSNGIAYDYAGRSRGLHVAISPRHGLADSADNAPACEAAGWRTMRLAEFLGLSYGPRGYERHYGLPFPGQEEATRLAIPGLAEVEGRLDVALPLAHPLDNLGGIAFGVPYALGLYAGFGYSWGIRAIAVEATAESNRVTYLNAPRGPSYSRFGVLLPTEVRGVCVLPVDSENYDEPKELGSLLWEVEGSRVAAGTEAELNFLGASAPPRALTVRAWRWGADGGRVYGAPDVSVDNARRVLHGEFEGGVAVSVYPPSGLGLVERVTIEASAGFGMAERIGLRLRRVNAELGGVPFGQARMLSNTPGPDAGLNVSADGATRAGGIRVTMLYGRMNGLEVAYTHRADWAAEYLADYHLRLCAIGARDGWRAPSLPEVAGLLTEGASATVLFGEGVEVPGLESGDVLLLPTNSFEGRESSEMFQERRTWETIRGGALFADLFARNERAVAVSVVAGGVGLAAGALPAETTEGEFLRFSKPTGRMACVRPLQSDYEKPPSPYALTQPAGFPNLAAVSLTMVGAFHTLTVGAGRMTRGAEDGFELLALRDNSAPDSGMGVSVILPNPNPHGLRAATERVAADDDVVSRNGFATGASSAWRVVFSAERVSRSAGAQEVVLSVRTPNYGYGGEGWRLTVDAPAATTTMTTEEEEGDDELLFNGEAFGAVGAEVMSFAGATLTYHGRRRGLEVLRGAVETDAGLSHCGDGWRTATYVEVAGLLRDGALRSDGERYVYAGTFGGGTLSVPGLAGGDSVRLVSLALGASALPSGTYAADFPGLDSSGEVVNMNVRGGDLSGVVGGLARALCVLPSAGTAGSYLAPVPVSLVVLHEGLTLSDANLSADAPLSAGAVLALTVEARGLTRAGMAAVRQTLEMTARGLSSGFAASLSAFGARANAIVYAAASVSAEADERVSAELVFRPRVGHARTVSAELRRLRRVMFHGRSVYAAEGRAVVVPRALGPEGATLDATMRYRRVRGADYFVSDLALADGWQDSLCAGASEGWRVASLGEALALAQTHGRMGALNGERVAGVAGGMSVALSASEVGDSSPLAELARDGVWADVYAEGLREDGRHRALNAVRPGAALGRVACALRDDVPEGVYGVRAENDAGAGVDSARVILETDADADVAVLTVTVREYRYRRNGVERGEVASVVASLSLPEGLEDGLRLSGGSVVVLGDEKALGTVFAALYRYRAVDSDSNSNLSSGLESVLTLLVSPPRPAVFAGDSLRTGEMVELTSVTSSFGGTAGNVRMFYAGVRRGLQLMHTREAYPDGYQEGACARGAGEGWRLATIEDAILATRDFGEAADYSYRGPLNRARTFAWGADSGAPDGAGDAAALGLNYFVDAYHPVAVSLAGVGLKHRAMRGPLGDSSSSGSADDAGILCARPLDSFSVSPGSPSAQRFFASGADALTVSLSGWRRRLSAGGALPEYWDERPVFRATLEAWRHGRDGAIAEESGGLSGGDVSVVVGATEYRLDYAEAESAGGRSVYDVWISRVGEDAGEEALALEILARLGDGESQTLRVAPAFATLALFAGRGLRYRSDAPAALSFARPSGGSATLDYRYAGRLRGLDFVLATLQGDGFAGRSPALLGREFCAQGGAGWRRGSLAEVLALGVSDSGSVGARLEVGVSAYVAPPRPAPRADELPENVRRVYNQLLAVASDVSVIPGARSIVLEIANAILARYGGDANYYTDSLRTHFASITDESDGAFNEFRYVANNEGFSLVNEYGEVLEFLTNDVPERAREPVYFTSPDSAPGYRAGLLAKLPAALAGDDRNDAPVAGEGLTYVSDLWLAPLTDGTAQALAVRFSDNGAALAGVASAEVGPVFSCVRPASGVDYVRPADLSATRFRMGEVVGLEMTATLRVNAQNELLGPSSFTVTAEAWRYNEFGLAETDADEGAVLRVVSHPSGWGVKVAGNVAVVSVSSVSLAASGMFRLTATPGFGSGGELALRLIRAEEEERGRFGGVPLSAAERREVVVAARSVLSVTLAAVSITMRYAGDSGGLHVIVSDGKFWDGYQDGVCAYRAGGSDSAWRVPTLGELAGILTDGDFATAETHDGNCQVRPEILGLGSGRVSLHSEAALLRGEGAVGFADAYVHRWTDARGAFPPRRIHPAVALDNRDGGSFLEAHDALDFGRARIVCVADSEGYEGDGHLAEPRFYSEGAEASGVLDVSLSEADGDGYVLTVTVSGHRRTRSGAGVSADTRLAAEVSPESGSGFAVEQGEAETGGLVFRVRTGEGSLLSARTIRIRAEMAAGEARELEVRLSP